MRQLTKWLLEPSLVLAVLALTCFGVAMIYSAGVVHIPNDVTQNAWIRQGTWFVLAVTAFIVVVRVPVRWIEWVALPSYTLSILLLVSTLVVGTGMGTAAGVKSWIQIGSFSFQPSEIAKIATILFLARFLSQRKDPLIQFRIFCFLHSWLGFHWHSSCSNPTWVPRWHLGGSFS